MRQIKKKLRLALRRASTRWLGLDRDAQISRSYLASHRIKKLHIGCGRRILPDWLNADYHPKTRNIRHLDATRPLPFDDDTFDFVFSEHMIEHFPFALGQDLIDECFRVLAPGATVRISTPDLAFLIDIHRVARSPERERSPLQDEFLEHFLATEIKERKRNAPRDFDSFLINEFVRAWGHQFIYDEKTLHFVMERSGFADNQRCEVMRSGHEALRDLEHVERKPVGHLALESMVLEATKPLTEPQTRRPG